MYDLRQLHYFVTTAEERNFTRAAKRCGVSQPPLSRQIALLEERVGGRLFDRGPHAVRLTELGETLLADARRLLRTAAESEDRLRRHAAGASGRLRLGFGGSTLYQLLPALVRRFKAARPDIELVFHVMPVLAQIEALRDDIIDAGLLRLPVHDELIETRHIHSEPLILAIPDSDRFAEATEPALADMANRPFIAYVRRRGFGYHNDLIALCAAAGFAPKIHHEAETTEAIVGMVACGEGIALVPAAARRLVMEGVVFRKPVFPADAPVRLTEVAFALAWRHDTPSLVTSQFVKHAAP
jgi:LysR family transcriptional regulator, benzoate and cis,cis-muconate-responsive activator of ben and cat genes